jgi:hypothetical protein
MKQPSSFKKPAAKSHVGPNLKLIRNLFIIAGLLIAIFIVWEIRHETRAKRERQNREAIERKKEARENALAEARAKAEAEARARQAELAALRRNQDTSETTGTKPPGAATAGSGNSTQGLKTTDDAPRPEFPPQIASLNTKARELVISAGRKRDDQLAANAKKLTWDLDSHLRTLPKSEQIHGVMNANRIKEQIENNRLPESILQSDEMELGRKMEEITTFAITKQKEADQAFISEAAKIQGAYIRKIGDAAKEAETAGNKPLTALLKHTVDDASDLGAWLTSLGVNHSSSN